MRLKHLGAAAAVFALAGCNSFLDVKPISELPRDQALSGPTSARASVAGIYDALQDGASDVHLYGNSNDFRFLEHDVSKVANLA